MDSLSCALPSSQSSGVTIKLTAHAWATFGGIVSASSALNVQIVDFGIVSCTGSCGSSCAPVGSSLGVCYCDDLCSSLGDCCANAADACVPDSCWERCDGPSDNGSCWCDDLCTGYGDCCEDKVDSCG